MGDVYVWRHELWDQSSLEEVYVFSFYKMYLAITDN